MSLCRIVDARVQDPFAVLKTRQSLNDSQTEQVVAEIIDRVRTQGDAALLANGRRFDAPYLTSIEVTAEELDAVELSNHEAAAIDFAAKRIEEFHTLQLSHFTGGLEPFNAAIRGEASNLSLSATSMVSGSEFDGRKTVGEMGQCGHEVAVPISHNPGERTCFGWMHGGVGQRVMPLSKVGCYVPGGKATYPSSVLMNVIPAQVAGVEQCFVTTPARSDGSLAPSVLFALLRAGVAKAFKIGGAAAIAAFAFGTESVPRMDKIVGPGNRFVNEAKRQLWGKVGLDGYAGPSEVCVLIDDWTNIEWACADLLTQIEHSEDNAAFVVSTSESALYSLLEAAQRQLTGAANEAAMRTALSEQSIAFIASDRSQAIDIINCIAPEHLTISTADSDLVLEKVKNAGAIMLGEYTPESAGDYVLGPSHTLPTSGAARFSSPLNVLDFLKIQSVSKLSFDQLIDLIPAIEAFGAMEGFPVHARGAKIRLE